MQIQTRNMLIIEVVNKGLAYVLLVFILIVSTGCHSWGKENNESKATSQAIEAFTRDYGEEVSRIIESYMLQEGSLDAHHNPDILKELMTGERLLLRPKLDLENEPYWVVTKSANVDHIRVIEYYPNHIKAIACLTIIYERRSVPEGGLLETYPETEFCALYIFVLEGENWKLNANFDTTNPGNIF